MNAARVRPRIACVLAAVVLAIAVAGPVRAQPDSVAIPPAVGFVNDHAGLLSESMRAKLESFLDQVKQKTGAEFAVLTLRSTAPEEPSVLKTRVFERWGLGRAGHDDVDQQLGPHEPAGPQRIGKLHEDDADDRQRHQLGGATQRAVEHRAADDVDVDQHQQPEDAQRPQRVHDAGDLVEAKRLGPPVGLRLSGALDAGLQFHALRPSSPAPA